MKLALASVILLLLTLSSVWESKMNSENTADQLRVHYQTELKRVMACRENVLRVVKSGRTRRSLFGPVDRVQLEQEYHAALRKDLEDASRRWSFDFLCETPLEGGDFLWEGVSEARLPVLYRPCEPPSRAKEGTPRMSEEKENVPRSPERRVTQSTHIEKTPEKRAMKRKQTNITDFYQMKKRLVATPRKSGQ